MEFPRQEYWNGLPFPTWGDLLDLGIQLTSPALQWILYAEAIIREIQVKTTMRYHLTPIRMAIIKISTKKKCRRGCGEKGTLLTCCWQCILTEPLWRRGLRFLKKLGIKLPHDPAIPLLGLHAEKTCNWQRHMYPNVQSSTISNSQDMEAIQMSVHWQMHGLRSCDICIYNGILLSHKKEWNWVSTSEVDEPRSVIQREVKSERDKYHILMHIYRIQKNGSNESICRAGREMQMQRTDLPK